MTHKERAIRRKRIAEDVKNGMTLERAAKKYGMCSGAIFLSCKEHGVKLTFRHHPKPTNAFMILRQLLDGTAPKDVAEKCEVTKQRVSQVAVAARKSGFNV